MQKIDLVKNIFIKKLFSKTIHVQYNDGEKIVVKSCLVQKYLDQIKFGQENMGQKKF